MALVRDYLTKTRQYIDEYGKDTIVLMQVGAFFEVYGLRDKYNNITGSNIVDFGRICDLNVVDKKACVGEEQVVMAGFKDHLLDKYIKKLQENSYTVVVFAQDEQCAETTRSCIGIFSPGTYFSTDSEQITNITCCIWLNLTTPSRLMKSNKYSKFSKIIHIGVATIDIYTGKTTISEYCEEYIKNPTTFDELERLISIYNPSETIIISNLGETDTTDIVGYSGIQSKSIHYVYLFEGEQTNKSNSKNILRAHNCEKQIYQSQLLSKFYAISDMGHFMELFAENVYSTQAFCYLLDFIYQHNPYLVNKIAEPIIEHSNERLTLANHSLKQLNIIDNDKDYSGKYSSVTRMLNECITSMGKRKFKHNFLNPTTNISYLQKEYNITETIINIYDQFKENKVFLKQFKDIEKICRQILFKKVSPKALAQLHNCCKIAEEMHAFNTSKFPELNSYLRENINNFDTFVSSINSIKGFLDNHLVITECSDLDNIMKTETNFIQYGVDAELDNEIFTLMNSTDELNVCKNYFNNLINESEKTPKRTTNVSSKKKKVAEIQEENDDNEADEDELKFIKIHETEKNNFSLIGTDKRCKTLLDIITNKKLKNAPLEFKSSLNGLTCVFDLELASLELSRHTATNKSISSPQLNTLCRNITSSKYRRYEHYARVYKNIVNNLEAYQENIEQLSSFITLLDMLYAKATIAIKYNYCKPQITPSSSNKSFVFVKDLRHCLIEKIQQTELYVANDIDLGDSVIDGILLYGTNAVGKTSFIRALGISIIMAQSGLFVPASSFKFHPYKYIFTRILGNDNIFKGLSTFAVEMSELRTILRLADKNSLVLGDELCSGTESISAVSIFVAGIQALSRAGCSFIFATHLHEIINYEEIISLSAVVLRHMSVIYDRENDCLIYDRKLREGAGTNMYGLEVCKSLSLPEDFLEEAHNIRMKYHPESASLLDKKTSHFNAKHIVDMCEKCGVRPAKEVHHLQHQQSADTKGFIGGFHKNHKANLSSLCEQCHDEMHNTDKKHRKVKTTKGTILKEL